jgi:hypothetical protein
MTLLELSISIANLGQRIDLSDRDLKAAGGQEPGKLREHVCSRAFMVTFRLHTILNRSGEVDDRVDSIRCDAQLKRKFDVPSTECVNKGIEFPSGYSADPIFNPISIGNRNNAVIGEPLVIRVANRESPTSGRVQGITASFYGKKVNIQARRGVIIATGGHSGNVEFRRMFDPRLTEEYQVAGEPWTKQNAEGEMLAMAIGASLWATSNTANEIGRTVTKTRHIGCKYGYQNLRWNPKSPMFDRAGASGLTVKDFQDLILVNQIGQRIWNEMDNTYNFLNACLGTNGNLGKGDKVDGGGPIWAIFDADAAQREEWDPKPPNVDQNGYFFEADTLTQLAGKISNPYQLQPVPARALEEAVARYNSFVDAGKDADFGKPAPKHKIQKPPFYAAWSTPILHDCLAGLRINRKCQVIDLKGQVIPGLYCCGESAGGFALHGLPRVTVFGRIAGREAALAKA